MKNIHPDEIPITTTLVRSLLESQFSHWAHLPLIQIQHSGTSNAIFRLGESMTVRLPRTPSSAEQVIKEHLWLPKLASYLPLQIPTSIAQGEPDSTYPFPWGIFDWIEGENATGDRSRGPSMRFNGCVDLFVSGYAADISGRAEYR